MEKPFEQEREQDQAELSSDELNAEQAAELPDREAMSLISTGGLESFAPIDGTFQPQPLNPGDYDTTQPIEPPIN